MKHRSKRRWQKRLKVPVVRVEWKTIPHPVTRKPTRVEVKILPSHDPNDTYKPDSYFAKMAKKVPKWK